MEQPGRYVLNPISGETAAEVADRANEELAQMARRINWIISGGREVIRTAPAKPQYGEIVVADGVSWNPGSGGGVYAYEGTSTASATWAKL